MWQILFRYMYITEICFYCCRLFTRQSWGQIQFYGQEHPATLSAERSAFPYFGDCQAKMLLCILPATFVLLFWWWLQRLTREREIERERERERHIVISHKHKNASFIPREMHAPAAVCKGWQNMDCTHLRNIVRILNAPMHVHSPDLTKYYTIQRYVNIVADSWQDNVEVIFKS
jgi:hypothetical protein